MDEIREEIREVNGERILLPEEEQLIGRFFAENTVELQDRGFTNRVMRRLPDRSVCLNRIWTAICMVAAVAVFILTRQPYAGITCFALLAAKAVMLWMRDR